MRKFFDYMLDYFKKSDSILLGLCLVSSIFGVVLIKSATAIPAQTAML